VSEKPNPNFRQEKDLRQSKETLAHLLPTDICNTDSSLEFIIDAWARLDEPTRQAILTLIRNSLRA
jgi:hypothetical protein